MAIEPRETGPAPVIAALLDQGRAIHSLALVLALAAIAVLLLAIVIASSGIAPAAMAGGALLFALAETYLALRVGFDAALFRAVATEMLDWSALDETLVTRGILPAGKAGRPVGARIDGALRLLRRQIVCLALEALLLAGGIVLLAWRAKGGT